MVLILTCVVIGQKKPNVGSLVGTISFVSEDGRDFIRFSPKTSITLLQNGKRKTIISNENGDYVLDLAVGKYCIFSIKNEDGILLTPQREQHKCFKMYKNKITRFDINLLE
jgi:hypothetical protein